MTTTRPTLNRTSTEPFRSLVRTTYPDVRLYALRRVALTDVDDVVAETYATAWRRWSDPPPTDPRLWLFGIARYVIRNQRRSLRRRVRLLESLPDAAAEPDGAVQVDAHVRLRDSLASLVPSDQEVLRLVAGRVSVPRRSPRYWAAHLRPPLPDLIEPAPDSPPH